MGESARNFVSDFRIIPSVPRKLIEFATKIEEKEDKN